MDRGLIGIERLRFEALPSSTLADLLAYLKEGREFHTPKEAARYRAIRRLLKRRSMKSKKAH